MQTQRRLPVSAFRSSTPTYSQLPLAHPQVRCIFRSRDIGIKICDKLRCNCPHHRKPPVGRDAPIPPLAGSPIAVIGVERESVRNSRRGRVTPPYERCLIVPTTGRCGIGPYAMVGVLSAAGWGRPPYELLSMELRRDGGSLPCEFTAPYGWSYDALYSSQRIQMEQRAPAAERKESISHKDQSLVTGSCWRRRILCVSCEFV